MGNHTAYLVKVGYIRAAIAFFPLLTLQFVAAQQFAVMVAILDVIFLVALFLLTNNPYILLVGDVTLLRLSLRPLLIAVVLTLVLSYRNLLGWKF